MFLKNRKTAIGKYFGLWHSNNLNIKNHEKLSIILITRVAKNYSFLHWTGEGPTRIEPDAVNMLDRIQVPTLIVTSEYDINACLEIAGLLDEKIENSTVVSIPEATHFMMMDKPQEFNNALVNFILSQ